jgi:hypothetical protein
MKPIDKDSDMLKRSETLVTDPEKTPKNKKAKATLP